MLGEKKKKAKLADLVNAPKSRRNDVLPAGFINQLNFSSNPSGSAVLLTILQKGQPCRNHHDRYLQDAVHGHKLCMQSASVVCDCCLRAGRGKGLFSFGQLSEPIKRPDLRFKQTLDHFLPNYPATVSFFRLYQLFFFLIIQQTQVVPAAQQYGISHNISNSTIQKNVLKYGHGSSNYLILFQQVSRLNFALRCTVSTHLV